MNTTYTINELAVTPRLFKSISNIELLTTYMEEALKDDTSFLIYVQLLFKYYPWIIDVLKMSDSQSVCPFSEIMKSVAKSMPDSVKYQYGSQNMEHFLSTIESYWTSGVLNTDEGKMKLINLATDILSSDDYEIFKFMVIGKANPEINIKFEVLYKNNNLPKDIYKYYLFSYDFDKIFKNPDDLFDNEIGTEEISIIDEPINILLSINNTLFKYDKTKHTREMITDTNIINRFKCESLEPIFIIVSGLKAVCYYKDERFVSCVKGIQYTEIPFGISVMNNINEKSFAVIKNINGHFIVSHIITKDELKTDTYKANSFNIISLPIGSGKMSLIDIATDDGQFNVFALKETTDKIGKNTKNFKYIEIHNNKYLYK